MNQKKRVRRFIRVGLIGTSILVTFLAFVIFTFAPSSIAKRLNSVSGLGIQPISQATQTFHQSIAIADLHADSLLWNRDLNKLANYGHVDIPRLIQGNVALQIFTVVTKVPNPLKLEKNSDRTDNITLLAILQRWSIPTWFSLKERALYQAKRLKSFATRSQNKFYLIQTKQDLSNYLSVRQTNPKITAGLLGIEGAQALEGKIENVDRFFEAGFRLIGLAHFFDNEVSGSVHGIDRTGLTSFGREVIKRMESLHIIIDLAHASPQTIDEVLTLTDRPVLVSHTGVKGTCDNPRNLSDRQIKQITQHGGIIGIGFWIPAICGEDAMSIARSIRYVADLVGVDRVALGSDFDGAVRLPFDVSNMSQITNALIAEKFTKAEIKKIMGLNVLHFLEILLPE
ncbi:MAG: dipeptidase [Xenococcaceae cyanobacterium]